MSVIIPEKELPQQLSLDQAVELAYAAELAEVASKLQRGLPTLIECDKDLGPFLFVNLRNRLKGAGLKCVYLDGRPRPDDAGMQPLGLIGTMIAQLRDAVRGAVEKKVIVLPHLDLLTTSQGGLTAEAREVIPLLYENPELVWLGFKDPSFPVPRVMENLFPHRVSILGIARARLRHLVTQGESRKFGKQFNPWAMYKYVSGVNAVRLRKLLTTLEGEDYPANPRNAYKQLRQATLGGTLEVPEIDLEKDIGGYAKVKQRLRSEILDVLARKDRASDTAEITFLEELIPRGMIFWGPPGTGKTLFAKGMAAALGAAITVVSGPEMKSKWVGESLPYEEEVLVILNGEARRLPIGELVEKHAEDEVSTWTVRDDGTALVSPVTGFLRHKGPDYIDVLITQTGREVRVTGGHSLFVNKDGKLAEVFAEQIEPGQTRIAIPLRLQAPETVRELNLLERLAEREDIRIKGYESWLPETVERIGREAVEHALGVTVAGLQAKHRPPMTVAAFYRLQAVSALRADPKELSLGCLKGSKELPAMLPLTEDLGLFLGKWTADGYFSTTGVRLTLHESELPYYEPLCQRLFGRVTCCRKRGVNARKMDLVINSLLLHRVMRYGFGVQHGSNAKRVPPFVFLAPLPFIAAFLRGYLSAGGTFRGKFIEATTFSRGLAQDVLTLLQYFGIVARCRRQLEWNGTEIYCVRFLRKVLCKFVDLIGFVEPERTQAVRDYLDRNTFRRKMQTPEDHVLNDVLWDLVVEKRREPYAREYVYDLSVPETERFIAGFGNVLVHNSEENIRQIFHQARQSAPSIIVFDELDSFASARGTYTGSGVEHSMVNQLLTEMDGFHKEELVFVIGTTNFVEILDPALLRPGRFEFHLYIPYPDADDRREILRIYDRKMRLQMTDEALEYAVRRTNEFVPGAAAGTRYSGDHLNALCRALARLRLRMNITGPTEPGHIEHALTEWVERPNMTPAEERVVATHEAGHAICTLFCPHARPIERISIKSEFTGAFGYVLHKDRAHRYITTRANLLDELCVLMGGREAEQLLLDDLSIGSWEDLRQGTMIARHLVEELGMGGDEVGVCRFQKDNGDPIRQTDLSDAQRAILDRRVRELLEEARERAARILLENREVLETLRDLLLQHKVIEAKALTEMLKN